MANVTRGTNVTRTVNSAKLLSLIENASISEIDNGDLVTGFTLMTRESSFALTTTVSDRDLYWDGERSNVITTARESIEYPRKAALPNGIPILNVVSSTITKGSLVRPVNTSPDNDGAIRVTALEFGADDDFSGFSIGVAGVDVSSGMVGYAIPFGVADILLNVNSSLADYQPGTRMYASSGVTGVATIDVPFANGTVASPAQVGRILTSPTVSDSVNLVKALINL